AAERRVDRRLRRERLGDEAAARVVQRNARLVAARFDAEDQHEWLPDAPLHSARPGSTISGSDGGTAAVVQPVTRVLNAKRPSKRKRTFRCRVAPLQARLRKGGYSDRAPQTRVLRKADAGAQAQEGGRDQAPPETQRPSTITAAAPILIPENTIRFRYDVSQGPFGRGYEGRPSLRRQGAARRVASAARRDQAARGRFPSSARCRRRSGRPRADDQAGPGCARAVPGGRPRGPRPEGRGRDRGPAELPAGALERRGARRADRRHDRRGRRPRSERYREGDGGVEIEGRGPSRHARGQLPCPRRARGRVAAETATAAKPAASIRLRSADPDRPADEPNPANLHR